MRLRHALPLLAVAAALAASPARAKDDLVIGVAQFPSTLHPNIDPEVIKSYVLGFAQRQVTALNKDWKLVCLLCSELPTLDNGLARFEDRPDGTRGMAVTLKLKPDLAWGDGQPVTARDVAFTWKVSHDPNAGFSNDFPWGRADKVDVVDDHTAVLHLPRVSVDYNRWDQLLPEHVEGPVFARTGVGGEYINGTSYARAPTTPGLWDGPYMVTGYRSGAEVVLEPNPHWHGAAPGFRRVVLRVIENTAALQANLLSGDVDMVNGEGVGLTIDQVIALRKSNPDRFSYAFQPSLNYEHVDLKGENPLLADARVRRALLMALDRETMVKRLFEGLQPVAATFVNPLDPMHADDVPTVGFDLPGAKRLLAEAGWTPGPDGVCRDASGQRLSLELGTTAGNRLRELQEQVLQNQWKAACVEVTIRNEPARTLFGETLKKRTYTGMEMYGWTSLVSQSPRKTLWSGSIPTAANSYAGANYPGFSDKRFDALIDAVETELDEGKRRAAWAEMQRIYADRLPVLPLFFRAESHVTPKWLAGYQPLGNGYASSIFAENWRHD